MAVETSKKASKEMSKPGEVATVPPEPTSASPSEDTDDDGDEEDSADDVVKPLTPPASETKGPTAKAPAKKTDAKAPAAKTAGSGKQSQDCGKKAPAGAVKGQKGEGAKAKIDSGKGAKDVKKASEANGKAGTPKSSAAQADTAKETDCTNVNAGSAVKMDPAVFTSPIFDVFVGQAKQHYMAHQAILTQSPLLARLMTSQAGKKGKQKTTIVLPKESPVNFETLLQYLYSHQLVMPTLTGEGDLTSETDGEQAKTAAKGLAKLFVLAHNYEMEGMELRITHALEATNLMYKIPGLEFFELAEKLYPDDIDLVKDDVFAKHFNEVAPGLIRTVPDKDLPELMRMVSAGGTFAEAIFCAYNTAVKNGTGFGMGSPPQIKQEVIEVVDVNEVEDERPRKRARTEGVDGADDGDAI